MTTRQQMIQRLGEATDDPRLTPQTRAQAERSLTNLKAMERREQPKA